MQLALSIGPSLPKGAYQYGSRSDGGTHGLVLTKPHVVEMLLDLAGYRADRSLASLKLLEPACGQGAFLIPAVERLMIACHRDGISPDTLGSAIASFDIEPKHVEESRRAIVHVLRKHGVTATQASKLAKRWVQQGDFLLAQLESQFDVVVGNPPYIRIEQLYPGLQAEYRARFMTLYDRADLYVAFIEKGLKLLSQNGILTFICADRWTLNKYGAPLRKFITSEFQVKAYIDLHRASPFESEVIAYPSIFVIGRERSDQPTVFASMTTASPEETRATSALTMISRPVADGICVTEYGTWFSGDAPWVISSPEHLAMLRSLEARFPLLEDDGRTAVRIGVATGNDKVYIVSRDVDIEADRLVPLVMRDDLEGGRIRDGHRFVVNTFRQDGGLVDLTAYPRLATYLETHEGILKQRHVAKKNHAGWFRTIDRVYPELVSQPKLLIPDIAGANEVVYEEGRFYPHHNLYFVVSKSWDLEVLGGLLSSRVALFFVWSYAVKMRGGYLRFQAQYLRRIRVPPATSLSRELCESIRSAFRQRDHKQLDKLAQQAYGLCSIPDFDFVDTRQ